MKFATLACAALTAVLAGAGSANADVSVTFAEGAPTDRFTIANTSACDLGPLTLVLDLSASAAGLVFDVTAAGAGVQVFQPFELVSGGGAVVGQPVVRDGDTLLRLELARLVRGEAISFTIDVDDTTGGRETIVSGGEITGARFDITTARLRATGVFDASATAVARMNSCHS